MARSKASSPAAAKPPRLGENQLGENQLDEHQTGERHTGEHRTGAARARPAQPAGSPSCWIELDPVVRGNYINGRHDMLLTGHAMASATITQLSLTIGGRAVAQLLYDQRTAPARVTLPNGQAGTLRRFHFDVQRRHGTEMAPCDCVVTADFDGADSHAQRFEIAVTADDPSRGIICSGVVQARTPHADAKPPVLLYVELATVNERRQLLICGWAIALAQIADLRVLVGDEPHDEPQGAAVLGGQRDDLAEAFPDYPNAGLAGFAFGVPLDANRAVASVTVEAVSRHGAVHRVIVPVIASVPAAATPAVEGQGARRPGAPAGVLPAAAAVIDPRRVIHCFCDGASLDLDGVLTVTGWAACATSIAEVAIALDGAPVGEATLGLPRPDVGELFRGIAMARMAGFQLRKRLPEEVLPAAAQADGGDAHHVRLVIRNGWGDTHEETVSVGRDAAVPIAGSPAEGTESDEFRLTIDSPRAVDGVVPEPVTGRLTIEGWALAQSGVAGIDVHLDDQRLGEAHVGLARPDVGVAFPRWEGSVRSGFAFHCPPRILHNGDHTVRLSLYARNGEQLVHQFQISVVKSETPEPHATIRRRIPLVEAESDAALLDRLGHHPRFRLVLRQPARPDRAALLATLRSLRHQVYPHWALLIAAADAAGAETVRIILAETHADLADRLQVIAPDDPGFDQPLADPADANVLTGLLTPGDELAAEALIETALASGLHPDAALLYADEVRVSPASFQPEPFFKPAWSPDLLLSTNYIGRPWFARPALPALCHATPRRLHERGEYDLVLQCTEQATAIHHMPLLLCQRGPRRLDDAATERAALRAAARRRGTPAAVRPGRAPDTWRFRRTAPVRGKVSIIIPTCAAHGYIETCLDSLRAHTAYRDYEIVCLDNIPPDDASWKTWLRANADQVIDIPEAFNWSRFNNRAVAQSTGEYLLFLNDDIEIVQDDWLDALLEHMQRPEVGIVGPQLLYPDRKVQHAGMFLASLGVARHAFRFAAEDEPGYFGLALTQRNVIAVTGACMLVRRAVFEQLGRFDEAHEVINNDLDFCLRAHEAGYLTVFTPHATLIHHELASRDKLADAFDTSRFEHRWKTLFAAGDPYFSPRLTPHANDFRPEDEPVQTVYGGHPLYRPDDIKRILVLKLDHIGDFITALPALHRLKAGFPHASIHLLAGRAAHTLATADGTIDGFIAFEFFHARSGLGQQERSKDDFLALQEQLVPYQFDLAIDLRKHPDTREVLRYTGARLLAGFDHMGQYGFLDIALEWEGDKNLQRKRSHVTDDLMTLVEAVRIAGEQRRTPITLAEPARQEALAALPPAVRALFDRPVVAIHPAVGSLTRQWPPGQFAALIDLLVERNGVHAVLIGGPDETDIAEDVLQALVSRDAVGSLVGAVPLAALPALLSACALFVGNNSGPKHIAAALGIPTIGIHSGVVDAVEWAPVGRCAVALRRSMACSPCYLARPEDCPRDLACLRRLEPAAVHRLAETFLARAIAPRRPAAPAKPRRLAADAE